MRSDKSDAIAVSSSITRIVSISNRATWIGSPCKAPQPCRDCCCLALQQDPARCCCSWPWSLLALLLLRFQNRLVGPKSWPTNTKQSHALLRTTKNNHTRCCARQRKHLRIFLFFSCTDLHATEHSHFFFCEIP